MKWKGAPGSVAFGQLKGQRCITRMGYIMSEEDEV